MVFVPLNNTVVIHWPRFGPYHLARLEAANTLLTQHNIRLVGLEISNIDHIYSWEVNEIETQYKRHLVFRDISHNQISIVSLFRGIFAELNKIQPQIIAVNGYSSPDAWAIFCWGKIYERNLILMSDSKRDDSNRNCLTESIKSFIVRNYASAICGGTPHKSYLLNLGLPETKIFMGYDVVDNAYFKSKYIIQRNTEKFRELPGLDTQTPYFLASSRFIPRKNLVFLVRAYAQYKEKMISCGRMDKLWKLIILGDGERRIELEQTVKDLNLKEEITLPGFQQLAVLPYYYGFAKVFIHPAYQDQWGLVVNEAMASSLPVLVSDKCGCAFDLVKNGKNGFTFNPYDLDDLSSKLFLFCIGEYNLEKMGEASSDIIKEWNIDRFAKSLLQAMEAALMRKRK